MAKPRQPCGFLLVDKPKGISSFFVVRSLRKILNMKRIGYAGTLDPLASGLMIVAVGEATKLLYSLEQMDKVYDVTIRLGEVSETFDAEGPITSFPEAQKPELSEIEHVLQADFKGERMQIPPRYSAVKIAGKHAYELVRKGKEVIIPAKKVVFYDIVVRSYRYPSLECSVHCSSGTYIRSFANDLGQMLHCGGYVQELRRTRISGYGIGDAMPLNEITRENIAKILVPPEDFLAGWQQIDVTEAEYRSLCNGGFVANRWNMKSGPALALYSGGTVGLLELCEDGRSVKFAKKFLF